MSEEMTTLKARISEIKLLLDTPYYGKNEENRNELLKEFDHLSYKYYKETIAKMRSFEGDGDGI